MNTIGIDYITTAYHNNTKPSVYFMGYTADNPHNMLERHTIGCCGDAIKMASAQTNGLYLWFSSFIIAEYKDSAKDHGKWNNE